MGMAHTLLFATERKTAMMGTLTPGEIEEVLASELLGRVGFIAAGRPYIVPVNYVYDPESAHVYVHSAEGAKVRAMRANPDVCFEVEQIHDMANWRTVVARATFEELWRDAEERAMDLLKARLQPCSVSETALPSRREESRHRSGMARPVLYRLHLTGKSGRFERT
jgi:nitroimidazol reductase NimA-like FMN-containing flavoprotein (pyridoxamine 5'-phosphate oxidase superfamily)